MPNCIKMLAIAYPPAQLYMLKVMQVGFSSGPLSSVSNAYTAGDVLYAAAPTFVTNLIGAPSRR